MKKFISLIFTLTLLGTNVLPVTLLDLSVPVARADACTISTDTTVDQSYIDTNSCQTINVDTSSIITFTESINLDDSGTFTVDEGVTATFSGTGIFSDSNDSIVINGTVTHADQNVTGVALSASGNVTIGAAGSINVDEKGYNGGAVQGSGAGPEPGTYTNYAGGGAGHGGAGGVSSASNSNNGDITGSAWPQGSGVGPLLLGSGGGGAYSGSSVGGDGGGLVYLDVGGTFTNGGTITADAGDGIFAGCCNNGSGGGAGGSIYVVANVLAGGGTYSAEGGDGGNATARDGGGGGGGRIFVQYNSTSISSPESTFESNFSVQGGIADTSDGGHTDATSGGMGTLLIVDKGSNADLTDSNAYIYDGFRFASGEENGASRFQFNNLYVKGTTAGTDDVQLTNYTTNSYVDVDGTLTLSNVDWTCSGVSTLQIDAANFNLNSLAADDAFTLSSCGDVTMNVTSSLTGTIDNLTFSSNEWDLNVPAGNDLIFSDSTITTTDRVVDSFTIDDAIDISLGTADNTNSSTIYANPTWTVDNVTIYEGSAIDMDEKGYASTNKTGAGDGIDGGGGAYGNYTGGGGGHGGAGGDSSSGASGGSANDTVSAPAYLGSAGGGGYDNGIFGGFGGGRAKIDVSSGTFTLNGNLTADAGNGSYGGTNNGSGGGAGGSIYVLCNSFVGGASAVMSAKGGIGGNGSSRQGGSGGGGLIRVEYASETGSFISTLGSDDETAGGAAQGGGGLGVDGTVSTNQIMSLDSVVITDTNGYTNDTTPVITLTTSGATATGVAYSCDNSNWTGFSAYPDDDVVNDVDGPSFDITTGFTGCSATEELKTIYVKVSGGGNESTVVNDTTTYDITSPTVSNVTASNSNGTLGADDVITAQVEFDETVLVDTTGGTPTLELDMDDTDRNATYNTGSGSSTLDFTYTIVSGDNKTDLAYTGTGALSLNSGTITDQAGNTADLVLFAPGAAGSLGANKDINVSTNQAPTVTGVTASQGTELVSGYRLVEIEFTVDDADDDDTLQAKVEFNTGTGWAAASILDDPSATYGAPTVDNDATYQIGQAAGYITTSSGANTITAYWTSDDNVEGIDTSSAQIRVIPYDGISTGTAGTSSTFTFDQAAPSGLGSVTMTATDSNTIGFSWAAASDTNFTNYKVYYKKSTDSAYALHTTITSSSTTSTTLTGLYAGATYSAYVVATDDYGNTTTSPTGSVTTSADNPVFGQVTGGGSSSSSSSSSTTATTVTTTLDVDSDELAGEEEEAEEEYDSGIVIVVDEEVDSPQEEIVEEPVVSDPVVEVIVEPIAVPAEEPSSQESTEQTTDDQVRSQSVSSSTKGQVSQDVYEDRVVVNFHASSDDSALRSTDNALRESLVVDFDSSFVNHSNSLVVNVLPGWTSSVGVKFPDSESSDDQPSSYSPEEVDYEEAVEAFVGQVDDLISEEESIGQSFQTKPANILEDILEDKDEDGVFDIVEDMNFGDTEGDFDADTDGDGLTDGEESVIGSDPFEADSDNDGITDLVEVALGTNPESWDSDGDGVSDTDELIEDTDPITKAPKEVSTEGGQLDSDGDGMSDAMEEYYKTDPNNADSDGDGISDADELDYDLDPNTPDYVEEVDTEVTNIDNGAVSNSSEVTVKGTAEPETMVIIYVFNSGGSYGGGAAPVSVLETTTDAKGKFAAAVTKELKSGNYSIFIASVDSKNKVKDVSSMASFTVDTEKEAPQIEILEFAGSTTFGLGSKLSVESPRPKMKAISSPGAIVYVSWKSLIFTSVVVADSQTGEFEVQPPQDLEEDDHVAYIYAEDPETGVTGKTTQVNFSVTSDVLLHQSAAQRESEDRFPYAYLLLAGLIAIGVSYVVLRRGNLAEDKLLKKL